MVHIHNAVLLSVKESEIIKYAGKWMELKNTLSEIIQAQKDKHCVFSFNILVGNEWCENECQESIKEPWRGGKTR